MMYIVYTTIVAAKITARESHSMITKHDLILIPFAS